MGDTKDGGPAFPVLEALQGRCASDGDYDAKGSGGMSLRDWFAGQMLVGMKLSGNLGREQWFAECAYAMADAMLAARSQPQKEE